MAAGQKAAGLYMAARQQAAQQREGAVETFGRAGRQAAGQREGTAAPGSLARQQAGLDMAKPAAEGNTCAAAARAERCSGRRPTPPGDTRSPPTGTAGH